MATRGPPTLRAALYPGECVARAAVGALRQRAAAARPTMRAGRGGRLERAGMAPSSARPPRSVRSARTAAAAGPAHDPALASPSAPERLPRAALGCRRRVTPAAGGLRTPDPRRLSRRTEGSVSATTPAIALKQRVYLGHWSCISRSLNGPTRSRRHCATARRAQPLRKSGAGPVLKAMVTAPKTMGHPAASAAYAAAAISYEARLPLSSEHRVHPGQEDSRRLPGGIRQGAPSSARAKHRRPTHHK